MSDSVHDISDTNHRPSAGQPATVDEGIAELLEAVGGGRHRHPVLVSGWPRRRILRTRL
jgi:hypothetical protein